jgi:hypothetical protein
VRELVTLLRELERLAAGGETGGPVPDLWSRTEKEFTRVAEYLRAQLKTGAPA